MLAKRPASWIKEHHLVMIAFLHAAVSLPVPASCTSPVQVPAPVPPPSPQLWHCTQLSMGQLGFFLGGVQNRWDKAAFNERDVSPSKSSVGFCSRSETSSCPQHLPPLPTPSSPKTD